MNNDEILKSALQLAENYTPTFTYVAIVDFTRLANKHRFFLINVKDSTIEYEGFTTHGSGSGNSERAVLFSNKPDSLRSSLGRVRVAESFTGKHGYSCKLDGLEDPNSNIRKRAIEIHPAQYATPEYVKHNGFPGRSWGCIGLDPDVSEDIIDKLKGGSMLYLHGSNDES